MSHVIIDGVIDIPRTKEWTFEHEDAKLDPDAVSFGFIAIVCLFVGGNANGGVDCRFVLAFAYAAADDIWI